MTAILGLIGLPLSYFISRHNYNLFHSFADGVSIVIAACAFTIIWNSRRLVDNNYFLYAGIAFLFFAFLDSMHLLGNKNMGIFPGYGNLGPTFYIASRYVLSISLLIAPLFINRKLNTTLMFAIYSLVTLLVVLSIFYWRIFPACIVEGVGLTPFKVVSDYIICLILVGAIGLLLINRQSFDPRVLRIIVSSIILSVATGLTFTLYTDPFGIANMVGHLFQIASFYLVYVAFIETSVTEPQEILFRRLKQHDEALTKNLQQLDHVNAGLQQEIAERKRAEDALRESETKYRNLFMNMAEEVHFWKLVHDEEGRINTWKLVDANPPTLKVWGKALEEIKGKTTDEIFGPGATNHYMPVVRKIMTEGTPHSFEDYFPNLNRHFRFTSVPLDDHFIITGADITRIKQAEEVLRKAHDELELRVQERTQELRKSEETASARLTEIETYYNMAPIGLCVLDRDFRYLRVNERLAEINGLPVSAHLGRTIREVMPSIADQAEALARKILESGESFSNIEFVGETTAKPGARRTCRASWFPIKGTRGEVINIGVTVEDITDQRLLEDQLRQAQKMEALGTLAGGIAHDFNNLLGAVIGFTELLQEDLPVGNPGHRHTARVMEAGLRGRDLVKQMLTFSRKTEVENKPLRLSNIVKENAKLLRASIPTTISINVKVTSESGVILADPVRIQQVLMNLCTNAYYAMREKGGTLDIELSDFSVGPSNGNAHRIEPGLYMKLTVSDTGVGIPAQIRDRIFDPFFTTKAVGEGTGLGLSVVIGIVKQCGGYITVESEPGRGSTFSVYFPKVTNEALTDTAVEEEVAPTGSERILFVDDEDALLEMGEQLLTKLGYKVTSQNSSAAALALIEENPSRFDLVITDQTMPDMTGLELAKRILAIRPDMPVILCTGFSHLVDADSARGAGIRGFAMKPLRKREIARAVREALDK
jgi:PAS domain S-box-containing protein